MPKMTIDRLRELSRAVLAVTEIGETLSQKLGYSRTTLYRIRRALAAKSVYKASQLDRLSDQALAETVYGPDTVLAECGGGRIRIRSSRRGRLDPEACLVPDFEDLARFQEESKTPSHAMYDMYTDSCKSDGKSAMSRSAFYAGLSAERKRSKRTEPKMYQEHPYGAELMIDYCGSRKELTLQDGQKISYAVIVLTWPASHYTWARFIEGMTSRDTVNALCEALREWQVKPALSFVIDNARSMVIRHSTGAEAELNRSFEHFCRQIKVQVDANNPYSPTGKSQVEQAVRLVQERALPAVDGRLCLTLGEYNIRLARAVDDLINSAPMSGRKAGSTRKELFELYEKPRAAKLEADLPEYTEYFAGIRVPNEYMVGHRGVLYSVPSRYIGKYVDLETSDSRLKILYRGKIIAEWEIMPPGSKPQILDEHMPAAHRKVREKILKYPTAESVIAAAGAISAQLGTVCRGILNRKGFVNGKKGCIRLINLYQRCDWQKPLYDDACTRMMNLEEKYWSSYCFQEIVKEIRESLRERGAYEKQTALPIGDFYSRGEQEYGAEEGGSGNE